MTDLTPDEFLIRWDRTEWTADPGSWRSRARRAVYNVVITGLHDGWPLTEIAKVLDDAYPFGIRQYTPYKTWLEERNLALWILGISDLTKANERRLRANGLIDEPVGDDQMALWEGE